MTQTDTVTLTLTASDGATTTKTIQVPYLGSGGGLVGRPTSPTQVGLSGVGLVASSFPIVGTGTGQVKSGPGWAISGGSVVITGAGTVFEKFRCPIPVEISAPNVVVRKCDLTAPGDGWAVGIRAAATNWTVQDCDFHGPVLIGPTRMQYGIFGDESSDVPGNVYRNYFYQVCHPIQMECGNVVQNFAHKIAINKASGTGIDHLDVFFSGGGTAKPLLIDSNYFVCEDVTGTGEGLAGCIMFNNAFGVQSYRTVTNNFLAGGNFTIYAGQVNPAGSNDIITDNLFSTMVFSKCGYYGYGRDTTAANTWARNTWADGPNKGQLLPAP